MAPSTFLSNKIKYNLISVLGWEERCYLGVMKTSGIISVSKLVLLVFKDYLKYTSSNLGRIKELCLEKRIELQIVELSYSRTADAWSQIGSIIEHPAVKKENSILDVSTMPRETIWSFIFFARKKNIELRFIYFKPLHYGDWLCKEPDKPRLLYKHSGVAEFGKSTALIILTGFDYDRTSQLVRFYEPSLTVLGIQKGIQFDNQQRNIQDQHAAECKGQTTVSFFEIDAYDLRAASAILDDQIKRLKPDYNIIVSSLGPKLSAISIYDVFLTHPEIALTYVPTKEYNLSYSTGIDLEPIIGILPA
ncbi:hypothetical protein [Dyadobacter sp. OTU695]|uniref:hypothetical protein n=1 Tax=Dyadobacter sp. OTU695 TaxID=3043860 RepID=UPI00313E2678